jgi:hypothetical protein
VAAINRRPRDRYFDAAIPRRPLLPSCPRATHRMADSHFPSLAHPIR